MNHTPEIEIENYGYSYTTPFRKDTKTTNMADSTQAFFALENPNNAADNGFHTVLDYIRQNANSQFGKGRLFERLIQKYFTQDPFYKKRFSEVYLWSEWAELRPEFDGVDIGIDLVAEETRRADSVLFSANATQRTPVSQKETLINSSSPQHANRTPPESSSILAPTGAAIYIEHSTA